VQSLESGHSEVLTQYLGAMARFHTYCFGNVMLIARQRAVTFCYTSLESMNMRSCALLEASDGACTFSEDNSVPFRIRSSLLSNLMLPYEPSRPTPPERTELLLVCRQTGWRWRHRSTLRRLSRIIA
jgi:hypothetical protein